MNKELDLEPLVREWEAAGQWRDQGEWIRFPRFIGTATDVY